MSQEEMDGYAEAMAGEAIAEQDERQEEVNLIAIRIKHSNADPMLKQALLQMLRLVS